MTNLDTKQQDLKPIAGDYQLVALTKGHPLQRAWHHARITHLLNHMKFSKADVVADIGCGSGINLDKISSHIHSAFGIDSNQDAINFCHKYFKQSPQLQFKLAQIDETGIVTSSLTKIMCMEVIEHVYENQVEKALQHWHTLLQPNGELYLTTPNYHSFWPILEWCLDRTSMIHQLAEEQHVSKWNEQKLLNVLKKNGFNILEIGSFNCLLPLNYFIQSNNISSLITKTEKLLPPFLGPLLFVKAQKVS